MQDRRVCWGLCIIVMKVAVLDFNKRKSNMDTKETAPEPNKLSLNLVASSSGMLSSTGSR